MVFVINTGKTKYIEVGCHRGIMEMSGQVVICMKKWKTFKYLSSLLANQNSIHEEIKCRLKTRSFMLLFSINTFVFSTTVQNRHLRNHTCVIICMLKLLRNLQNYYLTNQSCVDIHMIMLLRNHSKPLSQKSNLCKYTTLLEKDPTLFFLQKPGRFQWSTLAWGNLEPSYERVNFFSSLSIHQLMASSIWVK